MTCVEITTPDGYGPLRQGTPYRFVGNACQTHRVALAFFDWEHLGQPLSHVFTMTRDEFEDGLSQAKIVVSHSHEDFPPWLAPRQGKNLEMIDAERKNAKKSYREYIEPRLLHIQLALDDLDQILSAEDVQSAINAWAKRCTPRQNETRYRTWILTYLCFGRNIWTLLPPFHRSGCWERETHATQKQGAPSKAYGKGYGHKMSHVMADVCVKGYAKFQAPGKTLTHIYADTMTKLFECKVITRRSGVKEFYHPQGKPFPSLRQFQYVVNKSFGIENVQMNRYGSARHRRSLAPSQGRFSEEVAYLLEKVEFDGYFVKERPLGYLERSVLPPLCVVEARDMLSGAKLGIGFSFGAERMAAYRMALFSMAVPKPYFCSLCGIKLEPDTWITIDLPAQYKVDRGSGSSENVIASDAARPPIRNMTPGYSGQSKATVESSHPRDVKFEGEPHYIASNLTPVELARREIHALIRFNHTADMSARMPMDRELSFVLPTPHELWKYYAGKLRTAGIPMSIPDAVRTFLTPVTMTAKKDGVYLDDRKYDSKDLRACGLLNRVARLPRQEMPIRGYILDLCIRHVWIEVDHEILLLDAQLPIRGDKETLYVSIAELTEWQDARAEVNSTFRVHKVAAYAESTARFETETGKSWNSGTRKPGRAKKTAAARQEAREVDQHTSRRKSAS
ncbi:hypothetical protein LMG27952_06098 [Paraburkholderia hiiakae]|uniref:Transposase n=1 Tax=Paraburkholderia hiiakae TaxID=1081782 RepID=A0ABM8P4U4_9BURK|nr:hypothetical protein [Paraburkholderia hiiakae]CAD6556358.1 hypothetical protein LMG27952_06098 [Paraburkholderia hiiakae]